MSKTYNSVHTYVGGNSFKNIFGGDTPSHYGHITHIEYMTPLMTRKWPYLKNKWELSDSMRQISLHNTLKEAKAAAEALWPGCTFMGPKERSKITAKMGEW